MNKNFLWKLGFIAATLLFFLFGIFGIPRSFSRQGLLAAVSDHIHLGLDLKGGTHLILQVQVDDAVNVVAQNAMEVLKEQLRNRIDALGVSEPTIEEHGLAQHQILVQLPGIDDSGRVKDIMQSTAMLEIKQSLGGPYPSEQAAMQDKGGVIPADAILLQGHS